MQVVAVLGEKNHIAVFPPPPFGGPVEVGDDPPAEAGSGCSAALFVVCDPVPDPSAIVRAKDRADLVQVWPCYDIFVHKRRDAGAGHKLGTGCQTLGLLPSSIYGGRNADALYGWREDDRIFGGPGNDILQGSTGADVLRGGRGDDTLNAVDYVADAEINCGPGNDEPASIDVGLDPEPVSC